MDGAIKRITALLSGAKPDRPPLFDLIRNDAIIEHFSGRKLTFDNAEELIYGVYHKIVDGTRGRVRLPQEEKVEILEDGRKCYKKRWTTWIEHKKYSSSEEYRSVKKTQLCKSWNWNDEDEEWMGEYIRYNCEEQKKLGEVFWVWGSPANLALMGVFGEVGIEQFSYYLADCYDVIIEQLEYNMVKSLQRVEHLPNNVKIPCVFLGDDIAFKTGTILNPKFFRKEYFPRLKKIIEALHGKGIKVMFHSDGNLMAILDDLVESGIDLLNPIEVAAGMDIKEIHRRYPNLIMVGGIDVSNLLPLGNPEEIQKEVLKAIEDSEGKIMVGSSTELHNSIPLENFIAMRETVLNYRY